MEQQVKRAVVLEAEALRDAFTRNDPDWVRRMMGQFSIAPRQNCGVRGWLWKLSDGSDLILNDANKLIAAPRLRHL